MTGRFCLCAACAIEIDDIPTLLVMRSQSPPARLHARALFSLFAFNLAPPDCSVMLAACDAIQRTSMEADISLEQELLAPLSTAESAAWQPPREIVVEPVGRVAEDALKMVLRLKPRPSNIVATVSWVLLEPAKLAA